jgi:hypothetical protein
MGRRLSTPLLIPQITVDLRRSKIAHAQVNRAVSTADILADLQSFSDEEVEQLLAQENVLTNRR